MSLVLVTSIAIRLAALAWTLVLIRRLRDWRLWCLAAMIALMAARQILTLAQSPQFWPLSLTAKLEELPGLAVSLLAFLVVVFLERMIAGARPAAERLKESEARYRDLVEHSRDMIQSVDPEGRLLFVNRAWLDTLGYSPAEARELTVSDIIHPDSWAHCVKAFEQVMSGRHLRNIEASFVAKDGRRIEVRGDVACRVAEGGTRVTHGIFHDVTEAREKEKEQREHEARLARTRAQLDDALEAMSDGFALYDAEDRLVLCNEHYREIYAESAEAIVPGATFEDILRYGAERGQYKEAVGRIEEWLAARMERHRNPGGMIEQPTGDGRWVRITERRTRDGGTIGVRTDITELKLREAALRDSEAQVRLLLESAAEAVYGIDLSGCCTFANPACVALLGYGSVDDLLGRNMHELTHHTRVDGTPYPETECRIFQAFRRGEGTHVDDEVLWRADGGSFPAEYRSHPIRREGAVVGAVVTFTDITERRQGQALLLQASKLATLGEMATGMAHELNQPLNVIAMAAVNALERIEAGDLDGDFLRIKLARIEKQVERAAGIIDHMRVFGRKADERPMPFDMQDAVIGAMGLMGEQLRLRDIKVSTDFPKLRRKAYGHLMQLEQVILNLLANARDAIDRHAGAPEGAATAPREIGLTMEDDGVSDRIRLIVTDTGGGIPETALDRIFDPFFTTKEVGKGTGLGLSISYGIVTDMGGTIAAENVEGGARFTITLQVAEDDAAS